jgi:hypothetical protein
MIKLLDLLLELNLSKDSNSRQKVKRKFPKKADEIGDNLMLYTNPEGGNLKGGTFATVKNKENENEYADLMKTSDNRYYFIAKMTQPIKAGKALKALIELIPKGAKIGERSSELSSLSTDSFYTTLRKSGQLDKLSGKDSFSAEVDGYIKLNAQGEKRFRDQAKKSIEDSSQNQVMFFQNQQDAQEMADALNKEIKAVGIKDLAKVIKNDDKFSIQIPNIIIVKK